MVSMIVLGALCSASAQQLAFPTAEGYGKYVTGGRGGAVYEVTTLNATGAGSLGAALGASGRRTVVFRVAGTITGDFSINNGDITIAGQTAPGDGICIRGNLTIHSDNVIIRYLRVRHDPAVVGDAFGGRYYSGIIVDHVSTSWSADEVFSLYHNSNTTVQWCIIAQGCEKFENGVSVGHRFGGIWGNNYGTWHHNLIAHNDSRNPRWASGCGYNDYRNNVIYNWGYESCYGGEKVQPSSTQFTSATINMVANYYKAGPATVANGSAVRTIAQPSARSATDKGDWFVSDNYFAGQADITANNWTGVLGSNFNKLSAPWSAMAISQQTPQDAYLAVLAGVGCSFPRRDSVDADIVDDVRTGTAKYGNNGIISVPSDVGGWPVLASGTAPADSDHDGMPDSWETAHGLDPSNEADRNNLGADGYTNLEHYINGLVDGGGATPFLGISPASARLAATAGSSQTFSVTSNTSWTVSSNQSWLTVSPASGSNNGTVTVTAEQNAAAASRSATVTLAATGVLPQTVSVTQNSAVNELPTVSVTSPANGASFTASASITLNATAADSDGTVSSVAFYDGTTLLGTSTTAPYSFTWSNVAVGSYSLTARATDNSGETTSSAPVNITVNPPGPGSIAWNGAQNIFDDSDVSTTGVLVNAVNLTKNTGSYDANVTVNGVTFVRAPYGGTATALPNGDTSGTSDTTAIGAYEGFGGSTAPFNDLSSQYKSLLRSGHYNDGDLASPAASARITLTLNNLIVGERYLLQLWANDHRVVNLGQSNPGLITTVSDGETSTSLEYNVNNALGGIGQYVIGTFTATATTKVITMTGGNTGTDTAAPNCSAIWNAYQLRRIPTTYATWRAANFSGTDLTDDTISGPLADPDCTGLSNFARYAFDLDPSGPVGSPVVLDTAMANGSTYLTLSFNRRATGDDLSYILEASTDLVTWTPVSGQTFFPGSPAEVTAQDSVGIGTEGVSRRFLRLRVTTP